MRVEVKRFNSLNELIHYLRDEASGAARMIISLRKNLDGGRRRKLSREISEVLRVNYGGREIFAARIVYKPSNVTKEVVVEEAIAYLQRKATILRNTIDRLEDLGIDGPLIVLLVDSIPVVMIQVR
jgi:hypothetical protein